MFDYTHVKVIRVPVDMNIYGSFKQRCTFYEVTYSEFFSLAMKKFVDGDFDTELNIKKYKER